MEYMGEYINSKYSSPNHHDIMKNKETLKNNSDDDTEHDFQKQNSLLFMKKRTSIIMSSNKMPLKFTKSLTCHHKKHKVKYSDKK